MIINKINLSLIKMDFVIPLRTTYAQVHKTPLINWEGISMDKLGEEFYASRSLTNILNNDLIKASESFFDYNLFLRSNDIFRFLRNKTELYDDVITIVEPSLRDIYWKNKYLLDINDIILLESNIKDPLPFYKNILDYEYLSEFEEKLTYNIYHQYGNLTKFDVLHITVRNFIQSINNNKSLIFNLKDINTKVILQYQPYDFYDYKSESVKQFIPIPDLQLPM